MSSTEIYLPQIKITKQNHKNHLKNHQNHLHSSSSSGAPPRRCNHTGEGGAALVHRPWKNTNNFQKIVTCFDFFVIWIDSTWRVSQRESHSLRTGSSLVTFLLPWQGTRVTPANDIYYDWYVFYKSCLSCFSFCSALSKQPRRFIFPLKNHLNGKGPPFCTNLHIGTQFSALGTQLMYFDSFYLFSKTCWIPKLFVLIFIGRAENIFFEHLIYIVYDTDA